MSINGTQMIDGVLCISTAGPNLYSPVTIKAERLIEFGHKPFKQIRAGYWWRVSDAQFIFEDLAERLEVAKRAFK